MDSNWDNKVQPLESSPAQGLTSVIWCCPPPLQALEIISQKVSNVLVIPTARTAAAFAPSVEYAASVLCLSKEAGEWLSGARVTDNAHVAVPVQVEPPVVTADAGYVVIAAASHTALAQNLPRCFTGLDARGGVRLLTRGLCQRRRHVKTPRGFTHTHNTDVRVLPAELHGASLVVWYKQHPQDDLGLTALWSGVPVLTNRPIEGIDSPAVKVVNDCELFTSAVTLMQNPAELKTMREATHNGLDSLRKKWQRHLATCCP